MTTPRIGTGAPGPGRPKGSVNKTTGAIKDMILAALDAAGGEGGGIAYLTRQAEENPVAFMGLVGKVLPMQISGPGEGGEHKFTVTWEG